MNFDPLAEFVKVKTSKNVIAFYGNADYMSLGDLFGNQLVLYDFTRISKVIIVFYKVESKFYIILIDSEGILKEEDLNILDLSG